MRSLSRNPFLTNFNYKCNRSGDCVRDRKQLELSGYEIIPGSDAQAVFRRPLTDPSHDGSTWVLNGGYSHSIWWENYRHNVVDASTALGKNYTPAMGPCLRHRDGTGHAPVVRVPATREARGKALVFSQSAEIDGKAVLGRKRHASLLERTGIPISRGEPQPGRPWA